MMKLIIRDDGHIKRIKCIEIFIDKLKTIRDELFNDVAYKLI